MATMSLVLDKRRQKKDGTYPVVFQVVMNTVPVKISSGISVKEEDFDRANGVIKNSPTLNKELFRIEEAYRIKVEKFCAQNPKCKSGSELKNFLLNRTPDELTISEFWDKTILELTNMGRLGGANIYRQSKKTIEKHTDINIPFLKFTYRDLLNLEQKLYLSGMSINGLGVYLRCFRALCNRAIKEDIVNFEWYPFRKYKVKKERTTPRVISRVEMQSYFKLNLEPSHPSYVYWNVGKLIFMLRGINITDLLLLNKTNIRNRRIIYKRAKTGKLYSIQLTEDIEKVFAKFTPNETLLGLVTKEQIESIKKKEHFTQRIKVINKHLDKLGGILGLEEKLTTYVFRYSYANIARQLGYSKDLIAEALGHEYGNSVTGIYLEQFDLEIVDNMNDVIIKTVTT
jgi:integrase/recombinase XerD